MKKTVLCGICMLLVLAGCTLNSSPSAAPSGEGYTVLFFAEGGGIVTAQTKAGRPINNGERLPKNTEIVFTAKANDEHYINKWNGPDGLQPAADKGKATLTLTANATITVEFLKLDVKNMNWRASGKIKDAHNTERDVTMIISDGNVLTLSAGDAQRVVGCLYDKPSSAINSAAFKIKLISKPMQLPANWTIRFEGDAVLEKDGEEALRIKSGTEATVKVVYNNNNQTGAANGPYID